MTELIDYIIFAPVFVMLTVTTIGFIVAAVMPSKDKESKRFFMSIFGTLILCLAATLIDFLVYRDPTMAMAEEISVFFEYVFLSLPMPIFTMYLLHTCGENPKDSNLFRAVIALWLVFAVLLATVPFTTYLYYVTPDNQFCRGDWHFILMALMIAPMIINIIGVIRRRGKLSRKYYIASLVFLLPLTVSFIVHNFIFMDKLVFIAVIFSAISMFVIILSDQIEQYIKMQKKIADQRANIMVLQMRPHFIYNALMSIYYLCEKDSTKAKQVIMDFTAYLRKNFTAIASVDTIPFSEELEHTRAYLAIEQVQYEDALSITYDILHKEFRLPPLTLQPIVENAIKHGMDPEHTPLCITIKTRATKESSIVTVEDNGSGFSPETESNEPHLALSNIRERLKIMLGGTLTAQLKADGGTVVTVIIP